MDNKLRIDVWADLICPWCFVGKRRLEKALAGLPEVPAEVHWHAFELRPEMPPEGQPATEFFEKKFGANRKRIFESVDTVAKEEGIAMDHGRIERIPNTFLAHRLVQLAGEPALEALFRGHFEQGVNLSDRAAVLAHLEKSGLDAKALAQRLDDGEGEDKVRADEQLAAEIGISGVPFFIAARRLAVSGAHPAEDLREFLREAARQGESQDGIPV
jgi:predicted DsbA family dithiol-disulfide isomerase